MTTDQEIIKAIKAVIMHRAHQYGTPLPLSASGNDNEMIVTFETGQKLIIAMKVVNDTDYVSANDIANMVMGDDGATQSDRYLS